MKNLIILLAPLLLDSVRSSESTEGRHYVRHGGRKLGFFSSVWDTVTEIRNNWVEQRQWIKPTQAQERYDIVIIGAGMAGLAAAKEIQELAPDLTYVILESTDAVGGRVRSPTFGASGREVVIEDGANWLYDSDVYPTWVLAEEQGVASTFSDYSDFTMYDESGTPVDNGVAQARLEDFLDAFEGAEDEADENFEDSEQPGFVDNGVVALLSNNGWSVAADATGNMDYVFQWLYIDFEYAAADTSVRFFPYISDDPYLVHDQRGYRNVIETFKNDNIGDENIRYNARVTKIDYDENICDGSVVACSCTGTTYKAIVHTEDGSEYVARRVISTVSVGVLNSGDVSFSPALKYTDTPYEFAQYIKVFYQFETKFWDSTPFVYTIRDVAERGHCHHWQDMDALISGSGIIRCELMTEAFLDLIDDDTQELSEATLDSLLEPLRLAYGAGVVGTPIATYYPKLNLDRDFGYGAYANWQIGKTFTTFAKYFGGLDILAPNCDHNGCNSRNEWILYLSGAATCYEHAEFVHGGYWSGQRSARFALDSLGIADIDTDDSQCDISFRFLNTDGLDTGGVDCE